jgi:hypothetical protein
MVLSVVGVIVLGVAAFRARRRTAQAAPAHAEVAAGQGSMAG